MLVAIFQRDAQACGAQKLVFGFFHVREEGLKMHDTGRVGVTPPNPLPGLKSLRHA